MLYEFAIEPSILYDVARTKRDSQDFLNWFSVGSAKILSDFPKYKKLKRDLLASPPQDIVDIKLERLIEVLTFIGETTKVKRDTQYDGNEPWTKNIINEHNRINFDHVISTAPIESIETVNLEGVQNGLFKYPTQLPVKRLATDMSSAIANMLRLASHIVFVDPYFNGSSGSWNPFISFLASALNNRPSQLLNVDVVYGADKNNSPETNYLLDQLRKRNPELLSRCNMVFRSVREIPAGEKLHNRYVLTNIGGVSFGVGLDEQDENHQDDVILLAKDIYFLRWKQYAESEAFEIVSESISQT